MGCSDRPSSGKRYDDRNTLCDKVSSVSHPASDSLFPCRAIIYFNVAVYKEVRRNEKQIAANQVSLEAKEKLLKNKKAFYTTTIVLLVIFICYVPANLCFAIFTLLKDKIPANVGHITLPLVALLPAQHWIRCSIRWFTLLEQDVFA